MQGRLSPPIDKQIQAFPSHSWKNEFQQAKKLGFQTIEWIVDDKDNPIFYDSSISEIKQLSKNYKIEINSLCADIFMNDLLFKNSKNLVEKNLEILKALLRQKSGEADYKDAHLKLLSPNYLKKVNLNEIDISAENTRRSLISIQGINQKFDIEKILDIIFSDFCIGK